MQLPMDSVAQVAAYTTSADVRAYLALAIDLAKGLAWPITLAWLLLAFRAPLTAVLERSRQTTIKVAGAEISMSASEAGEALADFFTEVEVLLSEHLTLEQKDLFVRIGRQPHTPQVRDILPDFSRETTSHEALRALKKASFVRPIGGGQWSATRHIEVTTLGRLVLKHKRELLMPTAPAR